MTLAPAFLSGARADGTVADNAAKADIAEDLSALDTANQYLTRGLARLELDLREEALIDLTLAINQHALPATDQARALYNRGTVLEYMGDTKNAAADYAGALTLDSRLAAASTRLSALNRGTPDSGVIRLKPPASVSGAETISLTRPAPAGPAVNLKPAIPEGLQRGGLQIQLGAWRSESEANENWTLINARSRDVLDEFTPQIVGADVPGKGRYFRLRLGPMNKNRATQICAELKSRGFACIPVIPS